jgi:hypothetical protein
VHKRIGKENNLVSLFIEKEWNEAMVEKMKGNYLSNVIWECNALPFEKPLANDIFEYRREYITRKYINNWYVPNANNTEYKLERGMCDIY